MKPTLLYICNRERCGDRCSYPMCKRTTDISYAKDPNLKFTLNYADNKDMVFIQEDEKISNTSKKVDGPSKEIVREWRKLNPLGRKMQCHKDTKLSRPTVDRYWDLVLQEGKDE